MAGCPPETVDPGPSALVPPDAAKQPDPELLELPASCSAPIGSDLGRPPGPSPLPLALQSLAEQLRGWRQARVQQKQKQKREAEADARSRGVPAPAQAQVPLTVREADALKRYAILMAQGGQEFVEELVYSMLSMTMTQSTAYGLRDHYFEVPPRIACVLPSDVLSHLLRKLKARPVDPEDYFGEHPASPFGPAPGSPHSPTSINSLKGAKAKPSLQVWPSERWPLTAEIRGPWRV